MKHPDDKCPKTLRQYGRHDSRQHERRGGKKIISALRRGVLLAEIVLIAILMIGSMLLALWDLLSRLT